MVTWSAVDEEDTGDFEHVALSCFYFFTAEYHMNT